LVQPETSPTNAQIQRPTRRRYDHIRRYRVHLDGVQDVQGLGASSQGHYSA
jgi:hypothetical protein